MRNMSSMPPAGFEPGPFDTVGSRYHKFDWTISSSCRMNNVSLGLVEAQSSAYVATRGLLATDLVILNHGQVTRTTPELAPPLLTTTPQQREDVSALDRFNVHRSLTRWILSGTVLELVTSQPRSDTLTTRLPRPLSDRNRNLGHVIMLGIIASTPLSS
ncbi:uncharacterized protein TNCV_386601 [Trichonephila clavipes]|nr:uncharacterized protein TNCV_386601 [Trichonephila clavipes]